MVSETCEESNQRSKEALLPCGDRNSGTPRCSQTRSYPPTEQVRTTIGGSQVLTLDLTAVFTTKGVYKIA
jgi:hypothetical protein